MQKIIPFLWFDNQAEEAVQYYTSLFGNSKILQSVIYDEASAKASGRPAGSVLTIAFQIEGQNFTTLNGGPHFKINPSISFFITCETESEVDRLWKKLIHGGNVIMNLQKYEWGERYKKSHPEITQFTGAKS